MTLEKDFNNKFHKYTMNKKDNHFRIYKNDNNKCNLTLNYKGKLIDSNNINQEVIDELSHMKEFINNYMIKYNLVSMLEKYNKDTNIQYRWNNEYMTFDFVSLDFGKIIIKNNNIIIGNDTFKINFFRIIVSMMNKIKLCDTLDKYTENHLITFNDTHLFNKELTKMNNYYINSFHISDIFKFDNTLCSDIIKFNNNPAIMKLVDEYNENTINISKLGVSINNTLIDYKHMNTIDKIISIMINNTDDDKLLEYSIHLFKKNK